MNGNIVPMAVSCINWVDLIGSSPRGQAHPVIRLDVSRGDCFRVRGTERINDAFGCLVEFLFGVGDHFDVDREVEQLRLPENDVPDEILDHVAVGLFLVGVGLALLVFLVEASP